MFAPRLCEFDRDEFANFAGGRTKVCERPLTAENQLLTIWVMPARRKGFVMADLPAILDSEQGQLLAERDELRARLDRVELRLQFLDELLEKVAAADRIHQSEQTQQGGSESNGAERAGRLRPSDAIIEYVRHHPNAAPKAVVSAIVGQVQSNAADPARMLESLIRGLVRRRRLVRNVSREGLLVPEQTS